MAKSVTGQLESKIIWRKIGLLLKWKNFEVIFEMNLTGEVIFGKIFGFRCLKEEMEIEVWWIGWGKNRSLKENVEKYGIFKVLDGSVGKSVNKILMLQGVNFISINKVVKIEV